MAKKFYAVRVGRNPGVYKTWNECKEQVDQFNGAIYKGFENEADAWRFVEDAKDNDNNQFDGVIAYVDGSFDAENNVYSYGVVIINSGRETFLYDRDDDKELALMCNVAGEIAGSMAAMQYALDNGIDEILIMHDYEGIGAWPTRRWKTTKVGTENYVKFYNEVSNSVKIRFKKVTGHSGDFYNDLADALAKRELGVKIKKSLAEHIEEIEG